MPKMTEDGGNTSAKLGDHHGGSFRVYMDHKKAKLHDHFDRTYLSTSAPIFEGLCFYINGYTVPSFEELKLLIGKYGGRVDHYLTSQVNHVIATSLPQTKVNEFMRKRTFIPVTTPSWILDSIRENRRLPVREYLLPSIQKAYGTSVGSMFQEVAKDVDFSTKKSIPSNNPGVSSASESESKENASEITIPCISSYYSASRLHHLGSWRRQLQAKMHPLSNQLARQDPSSDEVGVDSNLQSDAPLEGRKNPIAASAESSMMSHFLSSANMEADRITSKKSNDSEEQAVLPAAPIVSVPNKLPTHNAQDSSSNRYIVHVDMDCFFVQVALLDYPHFRNCPVVVAQTNSKAVLSSNPNTATPLSVHPSQSRAEISSASYEARMAGVKRGMQVRSAYAICPDIVMLPYNFDKTRQISEQFISALYQFSRIVEVVSVDEAYLDLSHSRNPEEDIQRLREVILGVTGCVASVGLGPNKLVARLATDMAKPDGAKALLPAPGKSIEQQIRHLPVQALPGVGYATKKTLHSMEIETVGQLQAVPLAQLKKALGAATSKQLHDYAHGIDDRPLVLYKERQSLSAEMNWGIRFKEEAQAVTFLMELGREVERRLNDAAREEETLRKAADFHGAGTSGSGKRNGNVAFPMLSEEMQGKRGFNEGDSGSDGDDGCREEGFKGHMQQGAPNHQDSAPDTNDYPIATAESFHSSIRPSSTLSPFKLESHMISSSLSGTYSGFDKTPDRLTTDKPAMVKVDSPSTMSGNSKNSTTPTLARPKSNPTTPKMVKIAQSFPPSSIGKSSNNTADAGSFPLLSTAQHPSLSPNAPPSCAFPQPASVSSPLHSSSRNASPATFQPPSNTSTSATTTPSVAPLPPPLLLARKMTLKLLIRVPGAPPPTKPMGVGLCTTHTFSATFSNLTSSGEIFGREAVRLYNKFAPDVTQVRGIGITVHGLTLITSEERARGIDIAKLSGVGSTAGLSGTLSLVDMFQQLSKESKKAKREILVHEGEDSHCSGEPIDVDGDNVQANCSFVGNSVDALFKDVDNKMGSGRKEPSMDANRIPKVARLPFLPVTTSNGGTSSSDNGFSISSTVSTSQATTSSVIVNAFSADGTHSSPSSRQSAARILLNEIPEFAPKKSPRITQFFKEKQVHTTSHNLISSNPRQTNLSICNVSTDSVELIGYLSPKKNAHASNPSLQQKSDVQEVLVEIKIASAEATSHIEIESPEPGADPEECENSLYTPSSLPLAPDSVNLPCDNPPMQIGAKRSHDSLCINSNCCDDNVDPNAHDPVGTSLKKQFCGEDIDLNCKEEGQHVGEAMMRQGHSIGDMSSIEIRKTGGTLEPVNAMENAKPEHFADAGIPRRERIEGGAPISSLAADDDKGDLQDVKEMAIDEGRETSLDANRPIVSTQCADNLSRVGSSTLVVGEIGPTTSPSNDDSICSNPFIASIISLNSTHSFQHPPNELIDVSSLSFAPTADALDLSTPFESIICDTTDNQAITVSVERSPRRRHPVVPLQRHPHTTTTSPKRQLQTRLLHIPAFVYKPLSNAKNTIAIEKETFPALINEEKPITDPIPQVLSPAGGLSSLFPSNSTAGGANNKNDIAPEVHLRNDCPVSIKLLDIQSKMVFSIPEPVTAATVSDSNRRDNAAEPRCAPSAPFGDIISISSTTSQSRHNERFQELCDNTETRISIPVKNVDNTTRKLGNQPLSPIEVLQALAHSDGDIPVSTRQSQVASPGFGVTVHTRNTTILCRNGNEVLDNPFTSLFMGDTLATSSPSLQFDDAVASHMNLQELNVQSRDEGNQRQLYSFPFSKFTVETMQRDLRAWMVDAGESPTEQSKDKLLQLIKHLILLREPSIVRVFFRCFHRYCSYIRREQQFSDGTLPMRPNGEECQYQVHQLSWENVFQDAEEFAQKEFHRRYLHNFCWKS